MKATILLAIGSLLVFKSYSQQVLNPTEITLPDEYENAFKKPIFSDELVSSFFIAIKNSVPLHKHEKHSEHVYVLEGSGKMQLGEEYVEVNAGDIIIIPKNTPHSLQVTSSQAMKIISIQAPFFDGQDRVSLD